MNAALAIVGITAQGAEAAANGAGEAKSIALLLPLCLICCEGVDTFSDE
jgi:hypothetical protein